MQNETGSNQSSRLLILAGFLLCLLLSAEDGGNTYNWNVGGHLSDYAALYSRRNNPTLYIRFYVNPMLNISLCYLLNPSCEICKEFLLRWARQIELVSISAITAVVQGFTPTTDHHRRVANTHDSYSGASGFMFAAWLSWLRFKWISLDPGCKFRTLHQIR
jgi:hypothetical protein